MDSFLLVSGQSLLTSPYRQQSFLEALMSTGIQTQASTRVMPSGRVLTETLHAWTAIVYLLGKQALAENVYACRCFADALMHSGVPSHILT